MYAHPVGDSAAHSNKLGETENIQRPLFARDGFQATAAELPEYLFKTSSNSIGENQQRIDSALKAFQVLDRGSLKDSSHPEPGKAVKGKAQANVSSRNHHNSRKESQEATLLQVRQQQQQQLQQMARQRILNTQRPSSPIRPQQGAMNPADISTLYNANEFGASNGQGSGSNHALQDYQMQLMLLEQQNKKRLMMARQEQDSLGNPEFQSGEENGGSNPESDTAVPKEGEEPHKKGIIHYTISEDVTENGLGKRLYVMEHKSDTVPLNTPAPVSANFPPRPLMPTSIGSGSGPVNGNLMSMNRPISDTKPITLAKQYTTTLPSIKETQDFPRIFAPDASHPSQLPLVQQGSSMESGGIMMKAQDFTLPERNWDGIQTRATDDDQKNQDTRRIIPELSGTNWLPAMSPDLLHQMVLRLQELETENAKYQQETSQNTPIKIQVFHCLMDNYHSEEEEDNDEYNDDAPAYLTAPCWKVYGEEVTLRGQLHVADPEGYVEKQGDISFVIYKYYSVEHQISELREAMKLMKPLPDPEPAHQHVFLVSDETKQAVRSFFDMDPAIRDEFPHLDEKKRLRSPYIWWYHTRKTHNIHLLEHRQSQLVSELTNWIEATYSPLYDKIDNQFSRGKVSPMSMRYLVRPGRVLVSNTGSTAQGYLATARPIGGKDVIPEDLRPRHEKKDKWSWEVKGASLGYEGELHWKDSILKLALEGEFEDDEVDINSLDFVPLEYSNHEMQKLLERRGETFWRCRNRQLISYEASSTDSRLAVSNSSFSLPTRLYCHTPPCLSLF